MGITLAIPIGLGIKYIISDKWMLGYEIGYRQTISDFLDGFKSPSSNRPDIYWISTCEPQLPDPYITQGTAHLYGQTVETGQVLMPFLSVSLLVFSVFLRIIMIRSAKILLLCVYFLYT